MKYYLFKDWKYLGFIERGKEALNMLNALVCFQYHSGTTTPAVFTVLNHEEGFAFSQQYQKNGDGTATHRHMFKHEQGLINPDTPSYEQLWAKVDDPDSPFENWGGNSDGSVGVD